MVPIWQTVSPDVARESLRIVLRRTVQVSVCMVRRELSTHLPPAVDSSSRQEARSDIKRVIKNKDKFFRFMNRIIFAAKEDDLLSL